MRIKSLAKNQTEVESKDGVYVFVSYETPVAAFVPGQGILREDRSSSVTTARHVNKWIAANFPTATLTLVNREEIAALL